MQQASFKALYKQTLQLLKKYLFRQSLGAIIGVSLMAVELMIFLYFFLFSWETLIPAFCLACFFLTLFSFIVFRLHTLSKKSEFLEELTKWFLCSVDTLLQAEESKKEDRLHKQALAATQLAYYLRNVEYRLLSELFSFLSNSLFIQRLSCFFFWKDVFLFRENLLQTAVVSHIKLVRINPLSTDTHTALADAYVALSGLYADPRKYPDFNASCWIPEGRYDQSIQEKFRLTAQRAVEEFKILNEYNPKRAWVYMQLACSYHDLQMPLEEIQAFEMALQLKPNDTDIMMQLGERYFRQGLNTKGLRIYTQLKALNIQKAESIIKYYG